MKKNPILKNYCVIYNLSLNDNSDIYKFWDHKPDTPNCSFDDEIYLSEISKIYLNTENYRTGVIQALNTTEAKINTMFWLDEKYTFLKEQGAKEIVLDAGYSEEELEWNGFCIFNLLMSDYEDEFILKNFKQWIDLQHIELLKDTMGKFYNRFIDTGLIYENSESVYNLFEDKTDEIIEKFNLFNKDEKHFFKIWIHRKKFELFYIESLLKNKRN